MVTAGRGFEGGLRINPRSANSVALPHYTEIIKSSGGERTRVRVGPYDSREAAEKARQRMRSLKLVIGDASVVRQGD